MKPGDMVVLHSYADNLIGSGFGEKHTVIEVNDNGTFIVDTNEFLPLSPDDVRYVIESEEMDQKGELDVIDVHACENQWVDKPFTAWMRKIVQARIDHLEGVLKKTVTGKTVIQRDIDDYRKVLEEMDNVDSLYEEFGEREAQVVIHG